MTGKRFGLLSAVHLFLLRDEQVLLLRRFNTGYEDGNYSVVAGHLDGGEEIKAAMIREAREEVGVEIVPQDMQIVGVMHRKSDDERIDWFLANRSWRGEIENREPHRCDQLAWFDLDALPENVIPYVRRGLENYRRGIWFDSFGWPEVEGPAFQVHPLVERDRDWAAPFIAEHWGSEKVVAHGVVYDVRDLAGFVALQNGERVGLVTYHIVGEDCEIVSLNSTRPGAGIGTALTEAVKDVARSTGCRRVWLITTNDNLDALGFYQRRGFALVAVHRNALDASRELKPEIPRIGANRIPLQDEIELEFALTESEAE